jgi:excisionase family DNA binding protein
MTTLLAPQPSAAPTAPTEEEQRQALEAGRALAPLLGADVALRLVTDQDPAATLALPASARGLLYEILRQMAAGNSVTVHSLSAELTTQQAADYLNVSRPYLVKLLDEGEIPSHKTGSHRRVRLGDIVTYKQEDDAHGKTIMRELAAEAQELGMGY